MRRFWENWFRSRKLPGSWAFLSLAPLRTKAKRLRVWWTRALPSRLLRASSRGLWIWAIAGPSLKRSMKKIAKSQRSSSYCKLKIFFDETLQEIWLGEGLTVARLQTAYKTQVKYWENTKKVSVALFRWQTRQASTDWGLKTPVRWEWHRRQASREGQ